MAYEETEARSFVVQAGITLLEKKLIARTWGNISARISEDEFVITPSGRAYEDLAPEDLVKVKIQDLSYEGDVKPSSEKGIHAAVYALHKDVDFVVHTHQKYATAVSVDGRRLPFAPCAEYGLPGTKTLRLNVETRLENNRKKKAFLLSRHGALCFGSTPEEVFRICEELEEKSRIAFFDRVGEKPVKHAKRAYVDDFAQIAGAYVRDLSKVKTDDPEALRMIAEKNDLAAAYSLSGPMGLADASLQHAVYQFKYSKLKNK